MALYKVNAEIVDQSESRGLVVLKGEFRHVVLEVAVVVLAFFAQIIDLIMAWVNGVKETLHVLHGVAVDGLQILSREPHRNYPFSDI